MADKGIIFSAPMVRALLDGRKTQTRRLIKPTAKPFGAGQILCLEGPRFGGKAYRFAPPYAPGDRLYVREAHQFRGADYGDSGGEIEWFRVYGGGGARDNWEANFPVGFEPSRADKVRLLTEPDRQEGDGISGYVTKLRPSIHMPRWASRLTLLVTDVRVQRVAEISEEDARAEGVQLEATFADYRSAFGHLWNTLHTEPDGHWTANPFVVAVSFDVRPGNIDQINHEGAGAANNRSGDIQR